MSQNQTDGTEGLNMDDPTGAERVATEAAEELGGLPAKRGRLPDPMMEKIAETAFQFCLKATGIELYPYQQEFGQRIVTSIILEDTDELTALFSRQSGKTETIGVVVAGLMVLLPVLARQIPDERLQKFHDGLHVGIFGPDYGIVGVITNRVKARLHGANMRQVMSDPEIDMDPDKDKLLLPNGSFADGLSTNPNVNIEGHTYHLIICEETQNIPDWRIRKSIHPMGAATGATVVKIGTPVPHKCEFFEACQRNRRKDLQGIKGHRRQHFQIDCYEAAKHNPRYAKYIKSEIERLGEDSDDFRMAYRVHWILERGHFVTPDELADIGIKRKTAVIYQTRGRGEKKKFVLSSNVVTYDSKNRHVAGIDIGRDNDSTVVTVAKVNFDDPVALGGETVYRMHVANWLELQGDDHEAQYPQIVQFLQNYRLDNVVVDSTGRGDPVYNRLDADLDEFGILVTPYAFSQKSKHVGYMHLMREVRSKRLTYPAGAAAQRLAKWRRFIQQVEDAEKHWRGRYMTVEAPANKGKRLVGAHDDFPDSLMLCAMGTMVGMVREVEFHGGNVLFDGRSGRNRGSRNRQRAWWRG